ncbi:hypothetical protein B0H21DRAFT_820381 [Amylocystis lapponica]|nr:hypothetical protein B0H21DRAFT_820381 [Amylocystis lapponica]
MEQKRMVSTSPYFSESQLLWSTEYSYSLSSQSTQGTLPSLPTGTSADLATPSSPSPATPYVGKNATAIASLSMSTEFPNPFAPFISSTPTSRLSDVAQSFSSSTTPTAAALTLLPLLSPTSSLPQSKPTDGSVPPSPSRSGVPSESTPSGNPSGLLGRDIGLGVSGLLLLLFFLFLYRLRKYKMSDPERQIKVQEENDTSGQSKFRVTTLFPDAALQDSDSDADDFSVHKESTQPFFRV